MRGQERSLTHGSFDQEDRGCEVACVASFPSELFCHHDERMFAWLRRRRVARESPRAFVEADAIDLMRRFGDEAYYEARDRDREERRGRLIDANWPARH